MSNGRLISLALVSLMSFILVNNAHSQESVEITAVYDPNYPNPKEWRYFLSAQCYESEEPVEPAFAYGDHLEWYYDEDGYGLQHFLSSYSSTETSLDDNLEDEGYVYVEWWANQVKLATSGSVWVGEAKAFATARSEFRRKAREGQRGRVLIATLPLLKR